MEVQFEVRSCLEERHFVQYYKRVTRNRFWWCGLAALIAVFYLAQGIADADWINFLIAAYGFGFCIWYYRRPWTLAKQIRKRDKECYGNEDVPSVTTFGNEIRDVSGDMDAIMRYDKVVTIYVSKDIIVIEDTKKANIIIDKNGFVKGDFQSFMEFLKEKCPQAKLTNDKTNN